MKSSNGTFIIAPFLAFGIMTIAAWFTHLAWAVTTFLGDGTVTVKTATVGIIGAILPPFGIVHGVMLWIGVATW